MRNRTAITYEPDPMQREQERRAIAAEQRTWPVPPDCYWTTRRARVVLLRVVGPRLVELTRSPDAPPQLMQLRSVRRRVVRPSRVVLRGADGARLALHVLLPGEASPIQIGSSRTLPLPAWMVLDDVGGGDILDALALVFVGCARAGYNLAHLPSILARQAKRRAAAVEVVTRLR